MQGQHSNQSSFFSVIYDELIPADHMNNLTSVPLAIGAVMLARGEITQRGGVAPEACIPPDAFIRQLAKRDVKVHYGDHWEALIA